MGVSGVTCAPTPRSICTLELRKQAQELNKRITFRGYAIRCMQFSYPLLYFLLVDYTLLYISIMIAYVFAALWISRETRALSREVDALDRATSALLDNPSDYFVVSGILRDA